MFALIWILVFLCVLLALAYFQCRLRTAILATGALLLIWSLAGAGNGWSTILPWLPYVVIVATLAHTGLRRRWLTRPILAWFGKTLPRLSAAERTALEAGTVGWEAQLFSGVPDWQQLERLPMPQLSDDEQAFIDGPLQQLLETIDQDDEYSINRDGLTAQTWQRLAHDGLFGLAIPQHYGGLGFSAYARSCILARIASAPGGATLAPVVAAANALGPAQLLLTCGTQAQKADLLPRLASGQHIPCFALTSTQAGTNASALIDRGVICEQTHAGERCLGIRLNWRKRHITLAPVATLLGLAVRLYDPDRLLGHNADLGITCILVDADTPGVEASRCQHPIGAAFPYGTTAGHDVFVPLDAIIGGATMIGQGWRLIMEQLPIGRALSQPAAAAGMASRHSRLAGAYARIRHQFGRPIGSFNGIEEVLARIGGHSYACDALRRQVAHAVDLGERPAIAAAMAKYHGTTRAQQISIDSMHLFAGKAASAGPANPVAEDYIAAALNASADGTNVFTRSILIFGQGSLLCHPYLSAEIRAARRPDPERSLAAFDALLPAHIGHVLTCAARAFILGLSNGRGSPTGRCPELARHYQRINRYAAALALVADLAMASLGENLRHREHLSARLGDALSQLYIASATLQRYREDGAHRQDLPLVAWVCTHCFADIETSLASVLHHLPRRLPAYLVGRLVFPRGRRATGFADSVDHQVASVLQTPGDTRDRLTPWCYRKADSCRGSHLFDQALQATLDSVGLRKRLRRAIERGELHGESAYDCIEQAHSIGLLDANEAQQLNKARALHAAVVRVDDYACTNNLSSLAAHAQQA